MRISAVEDDPGHLPWLLCDKASLRIFFEGAQVDGVVTADEEKRLLVQLDRDEAGRFMLNDAGDGVRTSLRRGHVRIEAEPMPGLCDELRRLWPR